MAISAQCPHCHISLNLPDEMAGKMVRCKCGKPVRVPDPSSGSALEDLLSEELSRPYKAPQQEAPRHQPPSPQPSRSVPANDGLPARAGQRPVRNLVNRSLSSRLANGAFGASLFTFFGPGFHFATNPDVPRSDLAIEAAGLGIVIAIVGVALALVAKMGLSTGEDESANGRASAALGISGVGMIVWIVVLVM